MSSIKDKLEKYKNYSIRLVAGGTINKKFYVVKGSKDIYINIDFLSDSEKDYLKKYLFEKFNSDTVYFIRDEKLPLLERLYRYISNDSEDRDLLIFFKGKISDFDLAALELSLFIRREFFYKHNLNDLLNDIYVKYGVRGKLIANLCTAGYFDQLLKPLYENSAPTHDQFYEMYNHLLDGNVYALFVNNKMNKNQIKTEIIRRIELGRKYGLKQIHVHGIGRTNINKIKSVLNKTFLKQYTLLLNVKEDKEYSVYIAELLLH